MFLIMKKIMLLVSIVICCIYACTSKIYQNKEIKTGEVSLADKHYSKKVKKYFYTDTNNIYKIIYKDSITIINVLCHYDRTDEYGNRRSWDSTDGYVYADRRTKCFYHYPSLDPKCKFDYKWHDDTPDSLKHSASWLYFYKNKEPYIKDYRFTTDTVINNKTYKRVIATEMVDCTDGKKHLFTETGFLLCERKGTMFNLDNLLYDSLGCPMVMYQQDIEGVSGVFSKEIEQIDRPLTKFERKIFAVWERNARKNPVKIPKD